MLERLRYLIRRALVLPKAIASPVGLVATAAALAGMAALVLDDAVSKWLAALSLALWLGALLILGDRVRIVSAITRRNDRSSAKSPTAPPADLPAPGSVSIEGRRLASARFALAQIAPLRVPELAAPMTSEMSMSGSSPLVTIVVPCFNDSRFILHCLQSVKSQKYQDWECIVVDDASTDTSVRLAWEFARTDERFRVVRHTRNGGLSAARNTGLRLAQGELITFLDSDDFLTEDSLADRVSHAMPHINDSSLAGVYCSVLLAPEDAVPGDYAKARNWTSSAVDFVVSGDRCPFNVHAVLARTSIVKAAGGFDESLRHGAEDWDLWYRIMRNGFWFAPSALMSAIYRQKRSSMRQRYASEHFEEASRLTRASQQQADESVFFSGAVAPMRRPKGDYEISARLARRSIQSAASSLLAGDQDGAVAMLTAIEPIHPTVLARNVQPEIAIDDGFRRYFGLTAREYSSLRPDLLPLANQAAELVATHVQIEQIEAASSENEYDVLLLPQTSYQLVEMLDAVGDSRLRVSVVDSSSVAGDQGVADILEGMSGLSTKILSYNEAVLGSTRSRMVVLSYPWDAAIDELGLNLVQAGASAVSVRSGLEDTLRLDDAPPSRIPVREVSVMELAEALRGNNIELLLDEPDSKSRPVYETSLLAYRDSADAWTIEEYPDRVFDAADIARFKGIHAGERVVLIGNGPSLNALDLSLLRGTHTIGVNGIFYADDRLPGQLSYYVVEDTMVVRDNLERIKTYEAGHRFFPSIYREMIGEREDTSYFMMNRGFYARKAPGFCVPRFSTDASQRIYAGQSVTIMNLQLAYYMGFTEVILIGMDFSYTVPDSSQIEGNHITSMGDDPNHFHPDYFGKGKIWKDPKLERVLANYALAKQIFEADGRRIVNATPGGNLHLFDRASFEGLLRP